ncbi:MAG TPA: glycosyltransferase family A protein [Sphingomicrobium sp.]|nr:glycosyltransferase family A protein [Sphingomicrobium sp.]
MTDNPAPRLFSVSVVIPLFNKEAAVARTIGSVIAQTRPPDELIIVDDGSSDRSVKIARDVLSGAPAKIEWRIISQDNAGVSAARNRGADESRSRFIAFLDGDDEWLPTYLAEIERLASDFGDATVLTVRLAKPGPHGRLLPEPSALPRHFVGRLDRPLDLYRRGYGIMSSSSIVIRRDAWHRSGGFPPGVAAGEDMYWWLRLCMSEGFAHSSAILSVWHIEHSGHERRKGEVPYHLHYFLGTEEGRSQLANRDLSRFLASNLVSHVGGRKLVNSPRVVTELRRLSSALPLTLRLPCWAVAIAPRWSVVAGVAGRDWWRGMKQAMSKRRNAAEAPGGPRSAEGDRPVRSRLSRSR